MTTVEKQKGHQMKQDDATGTAEGTEKQQEDNLVVKKREVGHGGMTERRPDEARCHHSAAEDSGSHGRMNYAN